MDNKITISPSQVLVAVCLAHTGYRRAGLAFVSGENQLDHAALSEAQLAALQADSRLRLEVRDALPESALVSAAGGMDAADGIKTLTGHIAGVQEHDGTVKTLEALTVAELKEMAVDMAIEGARSMKKAELVEAIKATQVQVPAEDGE